MAPVRIAKGGEGRHAARVRLPAGHRDPVCRLAGPEAHASTRIAAGTRRGLAPPSPDTHRAARGERQPMTEDVPASFVGRRAVGGARVRFMTLPADWTSLDAESGAAR